jgi:hypothetical protein
LENRTAEDFHAVLIGRPAPDEVVLPVSVISTSCVHGGHGLSVRWPVREGLWPAPWALAPSSRTA